MFILTESANLCFLFVFLQTYATMFYSFYVIILIKDDVSLTLHFLFGYRYSSGDFQGCFIVVVKHGTNFYFRIKTFQIRTKLSSHNSNEIRNKILLKTEQNCMSSHNCNKIRTKLLKTEQKLCVKIQNITLLKEEQTF